MAKLPTNGKGRETEAEVKKLPLEPSGTQTLYWSNDLNGFGVLVGKSAKTYVVQGTIGIGGPKKRITIGRVDVWSMDKARERGRDMLMQMASGINPKEAAKKEAAEVAGRWTLRRMLAWVRDNSEQKEAKTLVKYAASAERWLGDWMDIDAKTITGRMVVDRYNAILAEAAKSPRSTDGVSTADFAIKVLSTTWKRVDRLDGELGRNPTDAMYGIWKEKKERTKVLEPHELPGFWNAICLEPWEVGRDVVIFSLLTGFRKENACALRVDEYDADAGGIRIAGERMKGRKDFEVPVSKEVRALLDRRVSLAKHKYLFEGRFADRSKRSAPLRPWIKSPGYVLNRAGEKAGFSVTVHDLRRTFGNEGKKIRNDGVDFFDLKMLLAHSIGNDVTMKHYTVFDPEDLRPAAQRMSDHFIDMADRPDVVRYIMANGIPEWENHKAIKH